MAPHVLQEALLEVKLKATHSTWVTCKMSDINLYADNVAQKPEKGKVHFYISDCNPPEVIMDQSSFSATIHDINKCQTIQSVIECSSQDYSSIHRKSVIFIYSSLLINLFRSCISSVYM